MLTNCVTLCFSNKFTYDLFLQNVANQKYDSCYPVVPLDDIIDLLSSFCGHYRFQFTLEFLLNHYLLQFYLISTTF